MQSTDRQKFRFGDVFLVGGQPSLVDREHDPLTSWNLYVVTRLIVGGKRVAFSVASHRDRDQVELSAASFAYSCDFVVTEGLWRE